MKNRLAAAVSCLAVVFMAGVHFYPLWSQKVQEGGSGARMPELTSFRILLGLADREPTVWDGSITVSQGTIRSIQGWRFTENDVSDYRSSWKVSTRRLPVNAAQEQRGVKGQILENGVIVGAEIPDDAVRFNVETANGAFAFAPREILAGESKTFLNGRVSVDRVPSTTQLTTSDEDEDFPALAHRGDDIYVAYVDFTHGDRSFEGAPQMPKEPPSFDFLARKPGGDQVMLMRYGVSAGSWSKPVPVSDAGQDVARAAVAIDGQKRVWVIWSANRDGNFDLYAKSYTGGAWSPEVRLTSDAGPDLNPVAATDAKGRVWIAWQGFRGNNLEILAAAQNGNGFSKEQLVSFSPASDWDPAIAAAPNGDIAISWDTYDKGDYDVYFRRMRGTRDIQMDAPVPVAASQNFEARSSVAFDPQNRLWVAYEASDTRWGKDFGAYQTTGIALYQGHNIEVKCFDGARAYATSANVQDALPGAPQALMRRRRRRPADQVPTGGPMNLKQPNPEIAGARKPNQPSQPPPLPLNSFPRITFGSDGTLYLAFRTAGDTWRSPVGAVWFENLVYFDGVRWEGPLFVPRTDGLLDNRPALAALEPGHLLIISAMDHRQSDIPGGGRRAAGGVNSDIYVADLRLGPAPRPGRPGNLEPLPPETVAPPDPEVKPELDQIAKMRDHRVTIAGEQLRVFRGELHRHSEISADGGRDGPLVDAYRYMIDAAYMDWVGCCDHDNGGGREYSWWIEQKLNDEYKLGDRFIPMFAYERSVRYPEGHRNVVFARRGIRPLPRLRKMEDNSPASPAPDTQMLYRYLKKFGGIAAAHTSATDMGTDWRDNDPMVEPVVEIYQGDRQNYEMPDAPRSASATDSIGGWQPLGFVSLALQKGYRLGFQASSDHISTHISYCNLWVTAPTREAILDALRKRRLYGATDNILADVQCEGHFMGEEFSLDKPPAISVKLAGTAPFAKVHIIKDNKYVYSAEPKTKDVSFVWTDNAAVKGSTSYYYVRGEQDNGELVWVSPMWIGYK